MKHPLGNAVIRRRHFAVSPDFVSVAAGALARPDAGAKIGHILPPDGSQPALYPDLLPVVLSAGSR
uniref:Uncharacterized protein n=1 Tax=Klebsiella aerogenes TaxID=548 RepID=Q9K5A4_KLEAE|nr:hypothetical protein [[Enterobacter] aerogenes] [Klebsiella aerogenes]